MDNEKLTLGDFAELGRMLKYIDRLDEEEIRATIKQEGEKEAETAFETFASGGDISVHEVMIASQKSGLAMQMAIQLRNQMLNAYNEFKGMSI